MSVTNLLVLYFFFFKQKTAYEMRISDWSSDVCSSDLNERQMNASRPFPAQALHAIDHFVPDGRGDEFGDFTAKKRNFLDQSGGDRLQIGRASCRDRVCQYV